MNTKIYVGNLPFSATESELTNAFSAHGNVTSAKVITDRDSGRSRGFGFVEMSSEQEAEAAIGALNGSDLSGRAIQVNIARPQTERSGGRFDDRRSGGYDGQRSRY